MIIAELTAFLAGINYLMQGRNRWGAVLPFIGSYGLVSTKNYLWAALMVALVISVVFFLLQGVGRQKILVLLTGGLLLAIVAFGSTTSLYALNFILKSSISSTGERSGDSITQIYLDSPGTGSGIVPMKELITFHGDYTLIALHCIFT